MALVLRKLGSMGYPSPQTEIERFKTLTEDDVTTYLCEHNHKFAIWGRHMWAQRSVQNHCRPQRAKYKQLWTIVKLTKLEHEHHRIYKFHETWVTCSCGKPPKKRAKLPGRDQLRTVASLRRLGSDDWFKVLKVTPFYSQKLYVVYQWGQPDPRVLDILQDYAEPEAELLRCI